MDKKIITIVIAIIIIIFFAVLWINRQSQPGQFDVFAKCLGQNDAKFYGAFWCPHCQNQKSLFGKSAKFLPYVECSTPDSKNQLQVCKDKNIASYPTWEFQDESRLTGEISLKELSLKTGCQLP